MLNTRYTRPARTNVSGIVAVLVVILPAAFAYCVPASAQDFDVNKVFWCNTGKNTGEQTEDQCAASRTMILGSCTVCHAFTPIVKAQKTKDQWLTLLKTHRDRVKELSDKDIAQIALFLEAHFNPQNPVPKLPPALDALGVPPA